MSRFPPIVAWLFSVAAVKIRPLVSANRVQKYITAKKDPNLLKP